MNTEEQAVEVDEKPRTLFIGNIPSTVKKRDLEVLFGDIGPIKRCHIQYPRKATNNQKEEPLVAYLTYALTEDATAAVEQFSNHKLQDKKLNIKLVKSRIEQHREPRVFRPPVDGDVKDGGVNIRVEPRQKRNLKKARLIVRNISFQTNEHNLKEHFGSCGEVTDVNILRKKSGKLVGCAFVQYKNVHEGFKALKELNAKDFLGRQIVIDWAVAKEKYQKGDAEGDQAVKAESEVEESQIVKVEDPKGSSSKIKAEDSGDDVDEDNDEGDSEVEMDSDSDIKDAKPRVHVNQNDADEGKTLFIRNLSFDVTEEELQEFFKKFGVLKYALICKDFLTEHPKGTGFVKFKDLDSAIECLTKFEEDSSEFALHDRSFFVIKALSKGKLDEKINSGKEKSTKDSRRLYLAREGFIRPGSDATFGVSKPDMDKRAAIHKAKNDMLKDLNIFVSDTRLCVHNLPLTMKDENLRKIFGKHAGPNAKITEARIMRDFNSIHRESKGYGFVTFTDHENALQALRSINNNPEIFTANKRPIVEFSLENRKAILAKQQRLEKSKEKLTNTSKNVQEQENSNEEKLSRRQKKKLKKAETSDNAEEREMEPVLTEDEPPAKKKKLRHKNSEDDGVPAFSGLSGKKGITSLPSLKSKGKITRKSLKRAQKVKLNPRRMREPKTLPKHNKDATDNVDRMVSKYQKQVSIAESGDKKRGKKWFD
ncbi:unnamed protein product [Allacma fusca]|uniref:RRM domain-containing protein n=1 Tax=Allacma fusca TaxID=39272 RepID=A0A8J2JTU3_9HEXA|nr:unnamed protein product [Allacma fusca]